MSKTTSNRAPQRKSSATYGEKKPAGGGASAASNQPKKSPQRNDMIRCERCGEDYSATYKRCPFCDERPHHSAIGGRSAASGARGNVHPVQLVALVVTLVLIICALFIVFKYGAPLLFSQKTPPPSSSSSQSQGAGQSSSQSTGDESEPEQPDMSTQGGTVSTLPSTPEVPVQPAVTVTSITLSKTDFTLAPDEMYAITASVLPANSDAVVTWTSGDPEALSVDADGQLHNINTSGATVKTTLTATAGDKSAVATVYCKPSQGKPATSGATGSTGAGATAGTTGSSTSGTIGGSLSAGTVAKIVGADSGLNIRSGPASTHEVLASAENGGIVTILEDAGGGWYKVDYGAGKIGYVSGQFLEKK